MICFGPERLRGFFVPRGRGFFFSPERLRDFFLFQEVAGFFCCPKRLSDIFLSLEVVCHVEILRI